MKPTTGIRKFRADNHRDGTRTHTARARTRDRQARRAAIMQARVQSATATLAGGAR